MKNVKTNLKKQYYMMGAAITTGLIFASSSDAHAQTTNFSTIANNINTSMGSLPGLITAVSYLIGILLGALGIMKIKDHVENPTQTPLKDGAIRLAAGGALFALPFVMDAMTSTIGTQTTTTDVGKVKGMSLGLTGTTP